MGSVVTHASAAAIFGTDCVVVKDLLRDNAENPSQQQKFT
jgi:hypothetical protein